MFHHLLNLKLFSLFLSHSSRLEFFSVRYHLPLPFIKPKDSIKYFALRLGPVGNIPSKELKRALLEKSTLAHNCLDEEIVDQLQGLSVVRDQY